MESDPGAAMRIGELAAYLKIPGLPPSNCEEGRHLGGQRARQGRAAGEHNPSRATELRHALAVCVWVPALVRRDVRTSASRARCGRIEVPVLWRGSAFLRAFHEPCAEISLEKGLTSSVGPGTTSGEGPVAMIHPRLSSRRSRCPGQGPCGEQVRRGADRLPQGERQ